MSVRSDSESSSKKRKLEVQWDEVVSQLPAEVRKEVASTFIEIDFTPAKFLKVNKSFKNFMCSAAGVEGWSDAITEKIITSQSGIPSSSNMTWEDTDKVLIGRVPGFTIPHLPICNKVEIEEAKIFSFADKTISAKSEADASARVIVLLLQVLKSYTVEKQAKFCVACQPTVSTHSTFTDYLIEVSGLKHVIIEVKRFDVNCNLTLQTKEVAQILREVQIWLNQNQDEESVTFLLTNSLDWSFGMAKRNRDKVEP